MAGVIFRLASPDPLYNISNVQKLDNYNIETIKMMNRYRIQKFNGFIGIIKGIIGIIKDYKK